MNILLIGFKTKKEVKAWIDAYSGGVEQDMSSWAEDSSESGYKFPWQLDYHNRSEFDNKGTIVVPMIHQDTYIQIKDE